ncbi:MAG: TraB/GumN family protein [Treponema sp.]|nr:TraB/GumN family protein [Treponema sp.]
MSQTEKVLEFNGRKITLIGTAHVSPESIEEVTNIIKEKQPDCVCVELDEKRSDSIQNKEKYAQLDVISVLKKKQGFLLMANLILASFQRRMGQNVGVQPGDEMLAAINTAKEMNIPAVMVDRPIQITLRRAWRKNSLWGKCKLLSALLSSAFSKDEVSHEEIENLKNGNEMDSMMKDLSEYMPVVKEVLIDERDQYLASHIWEASGNNLVAVLGAGHLPGVQAHLEKLSRGEENSDTTEISSEPKKSAAGKIIGWIIPLIIIALIVLSFIFGGKEKGIESVSQWIFWNAALAGIGTIIAGGHPLTVLSAMISAPITSLCPLIGCGFVTGIVQASVCKPKVKDMETLTDNTSSLKGFYKNRILRVLLVFLLSSLGSSIATFVGGAALFANLNELLDKIGTAIKTGFISIITAIKGWFLK